MCIFISCSDQVATPDPSISELNTVYRDLSLEIENFKEGERTNLKGDNCITDICPGIFVLEIFILVTLVNTKIIGLILTKTLCDV